MTHTLWCSISHTHRELHGSCNGGVTTNICLELARDLRIANNDRVIEEIYKKYGIDSSKELAFGIDFNDDGTIDESGLFPEEIEKVRKFTEEELNLYKNIEIDNQKWLKLIQGYRSPLCSITELPPQVRP